MLQNTLDSAQPQAPREIMSHPKEYVIILMALAYIDYKNMFDFIYSRAVIEALTNQED